MPTQGMDPNVTPPERRVKAICALPLENLKISSAFENRQSNPEKQIATNRSRFQKEKEKLSLLRGQWSKRMWNWKNRNKRMKSNPAAKSWKDSWFLWSGSQKNKIFTCITKIELAEETFAFSKILLCWASTTLQNANLQPKINETIAIQSLCPDTHEWAMGVLSQRPV